MNCNYHSCYPVMSILDIFHIFSTEEAKCHVESIYHALNSFVRVATSLHCFQEGKSDVEFLREEELVNGLHVSSRSYKPITCYQISPKGKVMISTIDVAYCTFATCSR